MSVVKKLSEADFGDFVDVLANAYPGARLVSQEDKEKYRQRLFQRHQQDPLFDCYGLYRDGTLVGGMAIHDFTMNLLSTKAKAGGLDSVAVDLVHKKEKVARDMTAYFLKHCKARAATLAMLYPFRPDFYKRMGFGYGTKMSQYRVRPASLPRGSSKEGVQILGKEDRPALLACYNRCVERTHGMIERSALELDSLLDRPGVRVVGYKKNGEILGYLFFVFRRGREDNWLINDIHVREIIYETREAFARLLTFLHTQLDQIDHIVFNLQDDAFHHLLLDPRNGSDNLIPLVYHESNTQGVGLLYRVVDTPGIFQVLREHDFGGQDCRLGLSIRDDFFPENDGLTIVRFENGRPHLMQEGSAFDVQVRLDVSDFSSMLLGVVSFKHLYSYGLADISDARYIEVVNALFRTEEKPVCMTEF